jgi:hypothetical protein
LLKYRTDENRKELVSADRCEKGATVFAGLQSCYAEDYSYGEDALSQVTRYHYYTINNGYFIQVRSIKPLADLSRASWLERRNYALLLRFSPVAEGIVKSFSVIKEADSGPWLEGRDDSAEK